MCCLVIGRYLAEVPPNICVLKVKAEQRQGQRISSDYFHEVTSPLDGGDSGPSINVFPRNLREMESSCFSLIPIKYKTY